MPDATPDQSLHLPSLVIKNFRGIDELTIPRLGRVTLLAGKNGVGKTTVLDAVRVYANRGQLNVLDDVLVKRGDAFITTDQNGGQRTVVDWYALFTDRRNSSETAISIGPLVPTDVLHIGWQTSVTLQPDQPTMPEPDDFLIGGRPSLVVKIGDSRIYPTYAAGIVLSPSRIPCNILGPNGPTDEMVEQYWSEVALTSQEDNALDALNLITTAEVERVAALAPPSTGGIIQPRRMMAKVKGVDYQVPLRTLGDGAMRTYAVALALAKSSGGFLLIDEAENGIHHSVQAKFWNMVLQTAHSNNVQVIATTHSADTAYRFGQVAHELDDIEGILYRIQRNGDRLRAVPYPEDQLVIAAEHRIEVR